LGEELLADLGGMRKKKFVASGRTVFIDKPLSLLLLNLMGMIDDRPRPDTSNYTLGGQVFIDGIIVFYFSSSRQIQQSLLCAINTEKLSKKDCYFQLPLSKSWFFKRNFYFLNSLLGFLNSWCR
jgi:hypothetical protein